MISLNQAGENIANKLGDNNNYGTKPISLFKEFKELASHSPLEHLLPYQAYDQTRQLFLNDDSIGFGLELLPLSGCGEDEIIRLVAVLNEKLPTNGNLHVQLIASNKIGSKLDAYYKVRSNFNEKVKKLALKRMQYYKKGTAESLSKFMPLFIRDYKLFIFYSEPISNTIDIQFEDIDHLRETWTTSLTSMTACQHLDISNFIAIVKEILNPSDDVYWPKSNYNEFDRVSEQLISLDSSYEIDEDKINVNANNKNYVIQVFNTECFPEKTALWQTSENIGKFFESSLQLSCSFIINLHIKALDKSEGQQKAQNQFLVNDKSAHSPLARLMPTLKKSHNEWTMLRENLVGNERLVKACYQVTLISNKKNYKKDAAKFNDVMASNGWMLKLDKYLQLPNFLQNLPFLMTSGLFKDLSYFKRFKTMTMFNAVNIMPLVAEWKGVSNADGLMYVGRRGQLINWSNFGGDVNNYNIAVAATSGAGKSFMMQDILNNILAEGGIVRIIDIGNSYKKQCYEVGGQYIDLKPGVCINPFTNVKSLEESINQLKGIVCTMAHPNGGTTDKEKQFISRAILNSFKKHTNSTTITKIIDELKTYNDPEAQDLTILLESYAKGGQYEGFFEGDCNINTNNPFLVLELSSLREMPDLRAVVVITILQQINEEFYSLPLNIKKFCLVDEATVLIKKDEQAAEQIEDGYRRGRKLNAGFGAIVQSTNDFHDNPVGKTIIANSATKLLLAQDKDTLNDLKKNSLLELTPFEERALRSFDASNPHYKECLIKTTSGSCVVKIIVDPYSRILYSTKGPELEAIKNLMSEGKTQEEAVDILADRIFMKQGGTK